MHKKKLPQPKSSNAQVNAYIHAVQKGLKNQHVVPSNKGWAVKKVGATRASRVFSTQADAIKYGRSLAKSGKTELLIHSRDGMIRKRDSFGSDPYTPTK